MESFYKDKTVILFCHFLCRNVDGKHVVNASKLNAVRHGILIKNLLRKLHVSVEVGQSGGIGPQVFEIMKVSPKHRMKVNKE